MQDTTSSPGNPLSEARIPPSSGQLVSRACPHGRGAGRPCRRPTTSSCRPATSSCRPATSSCRPATSSCRPATSSCRPATSSCGAGTPSGKSDSPRRRDGSVGSRKGSDRRPRTMGRYPFVCAYRRYRKGVRARLSESTMAELERGLIRDRTKVGLARAGPRAGALAGHGKTSISDAYSNFRRRVGAAIGLARHWALAIKQFGTGSTKLKRTRG